MNCRNCGIALPNTALFCSKCGTNVNSVPTPTATATPTPAPTPQQRKTVKPKNGSISTIVVLALVFIASFLFSGGGKAVVNNNYVNQFNSANEQIFAAWDVIVNASNSESVSEFNRGTTLMKAAQSALLELEQISPPKSFENYHATYVKEAKVFVELTTQMSQEGTNFYDSSFLGKVFSSGDFNTLVQQCNNQRQTVNYLIEKINQELS